MEPMPHLISGNPGTACDPQPRGDRRWVGVVLRVLEEVARCSPVSAATLTTRTGFQPADVTAALSVLSACGWIRDRNGSDRIELDPRLRQLFRRQGVAVGLHARLTSLMTDVVA